MDSHSTIVVNTTLPIVPPNTERKPIVSERLHLRPTRPSDLAALRALRLQPEVMQWTQVGVVDADMSATKTWMARNLPPNDLTTYNFAICLRDNPDDVIGIGGCHKIAGEMGWPEVGYMLRSEYWGKGYASEFLKAWLKAWDALPREEKTLEVNRGSVATLEGGADKPDNAAPKCSQEQLAAITAFGNRPSERVLEKAGFERRLVWEEADNKEDRPGQVIELSCWFYEHKTAKGLPSS